MTNRRNRETKPDQRRYRLNYRKYNAGTELIVHANEKGHKTKEANYAKNKAKHKAKTTNFGAYNQGVSRNISSLVTF